MTVTTRYNIGDKLFIDGCEMKIKGVHIYLSDDNQTERYYLGDGQWLTVHIKDERGA